MRLIMEKPCADVKTVGEAAPSGNSVAAEVYGDADDRPILPSLPLEVLRVKLEELQAFVLAAASKLIVQMHSPSPCRQPMPSRSPP